MAKQKNITQEIVCPVCGEKHTATFAPYDKVYLDVFPKLPIKDFLAQYIICTRCGCLYTTDRANISTLEQISQPGYQDILYSGKDDEFIKLALMEYAPFWFGYRNNWWAHYYHEKGNREQELHYTQLALNNSSKLLFAPVAAEQVSCLQGPGAFCLSGALYTIDLLRRLGKYEDALQLIESVSKPETLYTHHRERYLAHQKDLILQGNSNLL